MNVNEQANLTKEKILREEQEQASEKIHLIIGQIQKLSNDEKSQYLGSELITKTNIITNSNVGTKAPGQDFKFNFEENDLSQPPPSSKGKQRLTRQEEQTITHSTTNSSAPRRSKQQ